MFDGVSGNTDGGAVVSLERSRWLGVAEFFEGDTHRTGMFGIEKEAA